MITSNVVTKNLNSEKMISEKNLVNIVLRLKIINLNI